MIVRLELPPFGAIEVEMTYGAAAVSIPVELGNGAMYDWIFQLTSRDAGTGTFMAHLSEIKCLMPPKTPEVDDRFGQNLEARLPMMDQYGFSASLESEQRRKEWAARGVFY